MHADEFDTVVIGSGFGGAPVACRLAQADENHRVCVLERGLRYPPGSFARSPAAVARNFWEPSEGLYGLFDPWSFRHIEAVVASGLGGGSLIYANVLIRKDEKWFQERDGFRWPITREELNPFYEMAEEMLGATPYPYDREPYASTPKTAAFADAAKQLAPDASWELPKLAVSFTPKAQDPALGVPIPEPEGHENLHGAVRYTCRLVGECDVGCNFGAKNSLDFNYLSEAKRKGAEIRCLSEVHGLARDSTGYVIEYREHHPDSERPPTAHRLRASRVVLAAGTIGSTRLLLMNAGRLGGFRGPALGSRFCGNGDFLGFVKRSKSVIDPSRGPVITSLIRMPDEADGGTGRGFYIQEAGWPEFVNWLAQMFDFPGNVWRGLNFARSAIRHYLEPYPDSDVAKEVSSLLGSADLSNTSLGMLGMGRDTPDGRFSLKGRKRRLHLEWSERTSKEYFDRMSESMERIAAILGGDYLENPTYGFGRRLITVHPLGGCPMGNDPLEGVVDPYGKVFGHENLFVTDGSVMPGPVGPNPSLTIAAFAERAVKQMIEKGGAPPRR